MSDKKDTTQSVPPFTQSKRKHLVIIASLVAIFLGSIAGYLFFWQVIGQEAEEFTKIRDVQKKEEALVRYMRGEKNAVRDTKDERARLDTYFMNEKTVATFLGKVESLGGGMGLKVDTVSLGAGDGALRVSVHAEGAFSGIARFISTLEKMPFKLRIDRAAVHAEPAEGWVADLELSVLSFSSISNQ